MRNSPSTFRWLISTLIAILAAGSGIVALLNYVHSSQQPPPTPIPGVSPSSTSGSPAGTCIQGYVWREAVPGDHVCVTPQTRAQAQYDNSQAQSRVVP
ncbi:MAG TPA: hypothetical protein VKB35_04995 [Ktedonobacteraceae bacterium]|nr:hypothetical protein [Ktedonobacteraceae bacterium]